MRNAFKKWQHRNHDEWWSRWSYGRTFESFKKKYKNKMEESMKSSEFVFNYVHVLYYKCHKRNPNRGGSNIDSPDWIKTKNQQ